MMYEGFCGPSNQSPALKTERTVNLYYVPTLDALYPSPGRSAFTTAAEIGSRAYFATSGRAFAVIATAFYEWFADGTLTLRGTVIQDNYPATISYNGLAGGQLWVTSGGNGYLYDMTTHAFTLILAGEATQGGMVDSRFLAFNRVNGKVRASDLNNGAVWNALAYFQNSATADPWQTMVIANRQICLLGEETTQFWYNAGNPIQPFALISGSVFEEGICGPFAAAAAGNAVVWVSRSKHGAGRIMRAKGYSPQPISNYAVETAIAAYARASTIADAEPLVYQQDGQLFGVFNFPAGQGSWAVDLETGAWHELGGWNAVTGQYEVWAPRVHCLAFNKHFVGDRTSGTIAELDVAFGDDLGSPIRRLRVGPPVWPSGRERILMSRFELQLEAGLGLSTGQGSDPKIMARFSSDAKTWSAERQAGVGRRGEYAARAFWTRLGAQDGLWVPEVSFTEPIPLRITGATIEGSGFRQRARAA